MVQFCPECSSLLRKRKVDEQSYLACKCGYQEQDNTSVDLKHIEKKKKEILKRAKEQKIREEKVEEIEAEEEEIAKEGEIMELATPEDERENSEEKGEEE